MPVSKVKAVKMLSEDEKLDIELKKATIKEVDEEARYKENNNLVDKVRVIEMVLSSCKPGEKEYGAETNWIMTIEDQNRRETIEDKLIEIISKF